MTERRAQLLRYLRDCHRADSRDFGLYDIRKKAEHLRTFDGAEELANGLLPWIPVDGEWCAAAAATARLYRREKTLVYGAFFIVGALPEPVQNVGRVFAPLFLFPATIHAPAEGQTLGRLQIDLERQRINVPLLAALVKSADDETELEELLTQLPLAPLTADSVHAIATTLTEAAAGAIETRELYCYPRRIDADRLDALASAREPVLRCVPAAAAAVVPNPRSTRGVYDELSRMADAHHVSVPVDVLVGETTPAPRPAPHGFGLSPAVLNAAQTGALEAAARWPVSFVVGPPGTGKSYTLAAIALEHLMRGETVLIAARTQQALQVVEEKLEDQLQDDAMCIIRAGREGHSQRLKDWLQQLLHGGIALQAFPREAIDLKRKEIDRQTLELQRLERQIGRRVDRELRFGEAADRWTSGGLQRTVQQLQTGWRGFWARRGAPLWEHTWAYESLLRERSRNISWLLRQTIRRRIRDALAAHRSDLVKLNRALRARASATQDRYFADLELESLLHAFPLWLVTIQDIHRVLPLETELFDVALVDEATQCDMASPLPVAERARRLVVAGDPKQLRHVSFLSRDRRRVIAERHGLDAESTSQLDYRTRALIDLVDDRITDQAQVHFLDEHYRSQPRLIEFSNREFYRRALRVMTRHPNRMSERAVEIVRCDGRRRPGGANAAEVEALLERLRAVVEAQTAWPRDRCTTIGVLSPLRDQVDALANAIAARLPLAAIERHEILTGTAYGFQGEERDVMLLSLAVDDDAHPSALRYLNRPDVFNVAVTRARSRQVVFVSRRTTDPGSLLSRYLEYAASSPDAATVEETPDRDPFLEAVQRAIEARAFRAWPAWSLAGMVVDLVAEREGKAIGIDLVGAGAHAPVFPLERVRMLDRAGLPVFTLPYSAWTRDPARCVADLERQWRRSQS